MTAKKNKVKTAPVEVAVKDKAVYLRLKGDVWERIQKRAKAAHRTMKAECTLRLELSDAADLAEEGGAA